jgi:DNA repair protein RecN (Recombination protein N)
MLKRLSVFNFAIIKELHFLPENGFNVITGETGAGKSIIMDALGLILGERADVKSQQSLTDKCIIEGEFDVSNLELKSIFEELDLDFENSTIIRREINQNGKSRIFINDTPVSLQILKKITDKLVVIHSQHENTHLSDRDFQFNLLDSHAKLLNELKEYQVVYKQFKQIEIKLQQTFTQQKNLLKEKDYLSFLVNELNEADLQIDEESQLEIELQLLSNSEQISEIASLLPSVILDDESSIVSSLNSLKSKLKTIVVFSEKAQSLLDRIESCIIELKDIAEESQMLSNDINNNPQRLELINDRINLIYLLKRKHQVADYKELLILHKKLQDQLNNIDNIDHQLIELQKEKSLVENKLHQFALSLHQKRVASSKDLKLKIESLLQQLEMPKSLVEFDLELKDTYDEFGLTQLTLKFSANAGISPQVIGKVASGGELSRLALCIRTIEAKSNQLSTLIFDEIDTGVSGKVAAHIGEMFQTISKNHQLIAITHLPQVAASGNSHFFVSKNEVNNQTQTQLKKLDSKERIEELANMLSGNKATDIARKNAEELLKSSRLVKV